MGNNLAHFTDRQHAIAAFDRLWDQETPWILAFTGISGQGKSTLLDWLEANRCQPQKLPYALIGINGFANDIGAALNALIEPLAAFLPRQALAAYRQGHQEILRDLNQRKQQITQIQEMSGSSGGEQSMRADVAEALRSMERQADKRLAEAWLDCLGQVQNSGRLVFLLDNYDTFQEQAALEDLKFLWETLSRARQWQPGLRVALASREAVRHQNDLRVLESGLLGQGLEPLSAQDSAALLAALGVKKTAFQQAVYQRLAQGHPLITRLAAEAWLDTPDGIPAGQVPTLTSREKAVEWVQGRILERLSGALKEAVCWAALLRWFHADSLQAILEIKLSLDEFQALTRYAFVIRPRLAPQYWACHDLVRRVQMDYLRRACPEDFKAFHERAEAYYAEQKNEREALYHHFFTNPEEAFEAWKTLEGQAAFTFDHPAWGALMEIGLAPELALPGAQRAQVCYRAGRRHYYRDEWEPCEQFLGEALTLFRQVGDRLGEANVLKAIGDVQNFRDERDAALDSYAQALTLFRQVGDRLGEANVLKAIGDVQNFRDERDAALDSYAQALTLFRQVGARLGEANVLQAIGSFYLFAEDGAQAEQGKQNLEAALSLYQQVGARAGQANCYWIMTQFFAGSGALPEALEMAEQAYAIGMQIAPGHPTIEQWGQAAEQLRQAAAEQKSQTQP